MPVVKSVLGGLELQQVLQVGVDERESMARLEVPAMQGDLLEDLGRRSTRIVLSGFLTGADAGKGLRGLREKFRAGGPVTFAADITKATHLDQVLIEQMTIRELAGKPDRYEYSIGLRELTPPPSPTAPPASQIDGDIAAEAGALIEGLVGGLDLAREFATGLEKFVPALGGLSSRLQRFQSDSSGAGG